MLGDTCSSGSVIQRHDVKHQWFLIDTVRVIMVTFSSGKRRTCQPSWEDSGEKKQYLLTENTCFILSENCLPFSILPDLITVISLWNPSPPCLRRLLSFQDSQGHLRRASCTCYLSQGLSTTLLCTCCHVLSSNHSPFLFPLTARQ